MLFEVQSANFAAVTSQMNHLIVTCSELGEKSLTEPKPSLTLQDRK